MESKEQKIKNLMERNVEQAIDGVHLAAALASGKKLRVKLGIDPTSPDLHIGHAVVLGKLREFQNLGHKAVLIIGDFTARIGDPTGRSTSRKPLNEKEIRANMKQYLAQAGKVIDVKKAEIHNNSEWFLKEGVNGLFALTAAGTVQQMFAREDFKKRISEGGDVTVTELLYPLLQGYDSVKVSADVELGGHDQFLNLLAGRKVQRHFGMKEQDVMTVPLLVGLDGERKMSKSYGNYVGLTDAPENMFGKVMSVPDAVVEKYFAFCTDLPTEELREILKGFNPLGGAANVVAKRRLAFEITKRYHDAKKALAAQEQFENIFSKKDFKDAKIPEVKVPDKISVIDLVVLCFDSIGMKKSRSEARRLIEQKSFRVDMDEIIDDPNRIFAPQTEVVKIGRFHFRLLPKWSR